VFERYLNDVELLKCSTCKFVYSSLPDEKIEGVNFSLGEDTADNYREMQGSIDRHYFKTTAAKLSRSVGSAGRVLDIGCGNGLLLSQFRKLGWKTFGCDPSPWAADAAKQQGFTLYNCELKDSGIAAASFDLITCTTTLEHVARPVEVTREIERIMKPNGAAYFTIPNYGGLAIRLGRATFRRNAPPYHCNFFTAKTLRHVFNLVGLTVVYVRSYGIPEAYGVYEWIRRSFFSQHRRLKPTTKPVSDSSSSLKAKVLVKIYDCAGRPFNLGDKLEALVLRKSGQSPGFVQSPARSTR
jgi:2-polyprenyl-3-methyl-5-hydroxy-6-metoxy-1,4-benzoquinol methylase